MLSGAQIRKVARSVLSEFPGLRMGPHARWRAEDGSWTYEVDRPHSTRAITFGNILAGDFHAIAMEDEFRGETHDARGLQTEAELADFIRGAVQAEASFLGIADRPYTDRELVAMAQAIEAAGGGDAFARWGGMGGAPAAVIVRAYTEMFPERAGQPPAPNPSQSTSALRKRLLRRR